MKKLRKLKKICHQYQPIIDMTINELLTSSREINKIKHIKGYIADVGSGTAYNDGSGRFTVPLWAFDRRYNDGKNYRGEDGFFTHYVAHELAHQLCYIHYGKNKVGHNSKYYRIYMAICPKELWHFELHYKPSAKKYFDLWS